VVVLHISDGRFRESRLICSFLAMRGYDAVMLKMAYYGPRRPRDPARFRSFTQDLDSLREAVQQSAMDARRVARWLEAQPHVRRDRISILGTSLGGFVGSLASGVDGGFHRTIVILAGGRLEKVLGSPSRESRTVREAIAARGLKTDELVELLEPIEPCTFAARIDPRSVMMVNTRDDPVVPPASARALAETIGGVQILWYDGDHYALIWKLFEVLQRVGEYLDKSGKP
jgi:dienelactone hydrolase